jgi:hypothetical protein
VKHINASSNPLSLVSKETFGEVVGREGRVNTAHVGLAIEKLDEVPILQVGIKPHPGFQMQRLLKPNNKNLFCYYRRSRK